MAIDYGNYNVNTSGTITATSGLFDSISVNGSVPITGIIAGANISAIPSGAVYTISVSGSLGLTTEEVDDRVSNLLVAGTGIDISYDDNANTLTISQTNSEAVGASLYLWANYR